MYNFVKQFLEFSVFSFLFLPVSTQYIPELWYQTM